MPCRSIVPNGAAWARSAGTSPPATARLAACRSIRRPTNIAISNIICPMSATDCRSPARERGHEHDPDPKGRVSAKWEPVFRKDLAQKWEHDPDIHTLAGDDAADRRRDVGSRRELRGRFQGR